MPRKHDTHIRLSDRTRRQLAELMTKMGETMTAVIALAIDRLWLAEIGWSWDNEREEGE